MTDAEFLAFVEKNREYGFGRMMQFISDYWRSLDPKGALSVGDTYGILEVKRQRCAREGHDWRAGGDYDWCDRCEASKPKGSRVTG